MKSFTSSQLHRSSTDRVIAGVCGGLAETLQVDASLVRLVFIVGTVWGGLGLLLYIVLAIVLPVSGEAFTIAPASRERSQAIVGGALVVLGAMFLIGNLGLASWLGWQLFWPAVLIVIGAALLLRGGAESEEGANV